MHFTKLLPRSSAVDACAQAVEAAILEGRIHAGERLPPERQLAQELGVNRVTLRNALGKLSQAGLLSVRQGSGYVVRDFQQSGGPGLLPGLLKLAAQSGDVQQLASDLLLVRRQLAEAVLERLSSMQESFDLCAVEGAFEHLKLAVQRGDSTQELARHDVAVISAVVKLTDSPVFSLCLNPILGVLNELPELCDSIYEDGKRSVAAYETLLVWLSAPSPAGVPVFMRELQLRDEMTLARLAVARGVSKT